MGGLILEVRGDLCRRLHDILVKVDRVGDYIEVNLQGAAFQNWQVFYASIRLRGIQSMAELSLTKRNAPVFGKIFNRLEEPNTALVPAPVRSFRDEDEPRLISLP